MLIVTAAWSALAFSQTSSGLPERHHFVVAHVGHLHFGIAAQLRHGCCDCKTERDSAHRQSLPDFLVNFGFSSLS